MAKYSDAIEKIQRQSLKYIYAKIFQYYPTNVKYEKLLRGFEMKSLKERKDVETLNMLYNVLWGDVRNEYLSEIKAKVPRPCSKITGTFWIQRGRTKVSEHKVVDRACLLHNKLVGKIRINKLDIELDGFHQCRRTFGDSIRELVGS